VKKALPRFKGLGIERGNISLGRRGKANDRQNMGGRKLKKKILGLLNDNPLETSLEKICQFPPRQAVNPLFSFFYHSEELVKWRAVTAMGAVVARLAQQDIESSRIVMRRLMWNLNDESGGIGWGAPEAMGAYVRPELVANAVDFLLPFIHSNDAVHRGFAAWVSGALSSEFTTPLLQNLVSDEAKIKIFINMNLVESTVGKLAQEALSRTTRISPDQGRPE